MTKFKRWVATRSIAALTRRIQKYQNRIEDMRAHAYLVADKERLKQDITHLFAEAINCAQQISVYRYKLHQDRGQK